MATDPVCAMTVDEATALSAERDGKKFFFCGDHCRKKFLGHDSPAEAGHNRSSTHHSGHDDHRAAERQSHHSHEHHHSGVKPPAAAKYFCPMCPGAESDNPADCPKCGMALERNSAAQPPAPSRETLKTVN